MNTIHTFKPAAIPEVYDLCVVGGGLAGVMSAVSAARDGMRVILVEKYG
ncbi:MAG: FAD-dependent oxidoreductase, partial [Clostridia bacterium]|nr:FAD-dependent oxidoreductase [Clostridia bacterium]